MEDRADFIRESIDFLHRFLIRSIQEHAEEHGLTVPQLRVIAQVLMNKQITIKQLTKNLRMTQSTVSDIVERLSAKGILLKTPNPKDKRSVIISVSEEVLKGIRNNSNEPVKRAVGDALNYLSPDEQNTVEQGMHLLLKAVREKMEKDGMGQLESGPFR
ncbi:MarR family winged helix-turn-helix transcriptional regulator [Neobacillus muris]|uniref:MarR family winged helix-turn-helix transcriptional regulator n=1 Tax=Neobacillus muris TaxID=2941334 RepID=UPI00203DA9DE|nr:helix-turn-helix domain-containing protein [Neobacillus muris]